jgi:hypothetical protein
VTLLLRPADLLVRGALVISGKGVESRAHPWALLGLPGMKDFVDEIREMFRQGNSRNLKYPKRHSRHHHQMPSTRGGQQVEGAAVAHGII